MADDTDDIFKPKLGRIRSWGGARAKTYLNRVLDKMSAAGSGGFGKPAGRARFSGYRIGRGNDAMRHRRAGHRFGPSYRRVVIKTRIVKLEDPSFPEPIYAALFEDEDGGARLAWNRQK